MRNWSARAAAALLLVMAARVPLHGQTWSNGSGGAIYYNGGNVGIGTITPVWPLHLGFNNKLRIDGATTNTDTNNYFSMGGWGTFGIDAYGVANGRFVVLTNGNVGIGTTNPSHLLQVAGTIGAEEVIVTPTGADYVFEPGYRLKPLSEIATYIRANHHLPDIPSAEEGKQKGVGVGDMQSKLLAKIEELMLHMIRADERNNRLEKQNQELRDRISRLEAQSGR